jgi:hypothetical protein
MLIFLQFFLERLLSKIKCRCDVCSCDREFEQIDRDLLLNLITHGKVDTRRGVPLQAGLEVTCAKIVLQEITIVKTRKTK